MDAVHPVGVHVVGEPPGAADAGDEHDLVRRDPELGHELLDSREDRVVAAAWAPARLLVGLEVGLGQRFRRAAVALRNGGHDRASISRWISAANSGWPCTLQNDSMSTRNRPRNSSASCPEFISGTSTRSKDRSTSPVLDGNGFR